MKDAKEFFIPEGRVIRASVNGVDVWRRIALVSMGDSIPAGHAINGDWAANYGPGSQYGQNGNTQTALVPGCYTALMLKDMAAECGEERATAASFARSGDKVEDLMEKLDHETVREAIRNATRVVVCIGANNVLGPVEKYLETYINTGDLAPLAATVNSNLTKLANDSDPNSYRALFDKLNAINPNARYVFATIYNPYKYLWLDESRSGFFGPVLSAIPNMDVDVDGAVEDFFNIDDLGYFDLSSMSWKSIELNYDLDGAIKDGLLSTPAVRTLFSRVNGLCDWAEGFVTSLNSVLCAKIEEYRAINPRFCIADTKAIFDTYPDRPSGAPVCYNDLVNVEYTRGYDLAKINWGRLWPGSNAATFYGDLAWKHLSFKNAVPSLNVDDYVSFDLNGFASELVDLIVERVITPDVDPHPKAHGHEVLRQSFDAAMKAKQ